MKPTVVSSRELSLYPLLPLPQCDFRVDARTGGEVYIYDTLRKKWLLLTPEEWVRQHFVQFLIRHKGYPAHAFSCETALSNSTRRGRTDTIIFGAKGRTWAVIEYKAAHLRLEAKMWSQLQAYNLNCQTDLICLTNGVQQIVCLLGREGYTYLEEIPTFDELRSHYAQND